ncbi:MAG TPA: transglutaminase family protein [Acidimicrobiales bacterium]|nr:transglutaminase family protein [Acidimicrobiales bacterium]
MIVIDSAPGGRLVDHAGVDWARVARVRFSLHQRIRYDYGSPALRLHHRLMVLPPTFHGDQRVLSSRVDVTGAEVVVRQCVDTFGNARYEFLAERVEEALEFEVEAEVERRPSEGMTRLPAAALFDSRLLEPTPLTWPDLALRSAADRLAREGPGGLALAGRINAWVFKVMRYRPGVTNVDTTAARALGLAQGVCQDYAHIMLALCRLAALPARYVSGHLLGEGGSHAWVEVVVGDGDHAVAVPFDPTHGREVGASYLSIAVGRDYADVAPTYGTFLGDSPGVLSSVKRLGVSELDLVGSSHP